MEGMVKGGVGELVLTYSASCHGENANGRDCRTGQ